MSQVFELFEDFKRQFARAGYADPQEYLVKVEGDKRAQLSGLIDAYLDRAPARYSDEATYRRSAAAEVASALDDIVGQPAGMFPIVLPRLRKRAKLRRAELAGLLAAELGLTGKEKRVAEAYHDLETGQLDTARVKPPVMEALARILGESADSLRSYGRRLGAPRPAPPSQGVAFARPAYRGMASPGTTRPPRAPAEWDEVDELFRGGSDADD
jgi:hypothetical protein